MQREIEKTDEVLEEIREVSEEYEPLAKMTSKIFFTLESLSSIHYLYQFSLQQFMDGVFFVLNNKQEVCEIPKSEPQKRLQMITKCLFIHMN
jgi:dynein heavy chain 1